MKKTRTLLALMLSLLLLFGLAPTAFADGNSHFVIVDVVNLSSDAPEYTTPGSDLVIAFTADDGYAVPPDVSLSIGGGPGVPATISGNTLIIYNADITGNVVIVGMATPLPQFLTFDVNPPSSGTISNAPVSPTTITTGTALGNAITTPTIDDDFTFVGWFDAGNVRYDASSVMPYDGLELIGKWGHNVTVKFLPGTSEVVHDMPTSNIDTYMGAVITLPGDLWREGYFFMGWMQTEPNNEEISWPSNPYTVPSGNQEDEVTLTAQWMYDVETGENNPNNNHPRWPYYSFSNGPRPTPTPYVPDDSLDEEVSVPYTGDHSNIVLPLCLTVLGVIVATARRKKNEV